MTQYEISDLARKYAPWSISKAELAEVCPAQFRHKYLLKSEGVATAANSDNKVGIVAHAILEHRVKGTSNAEARKLAKVDELMSTEAETLRTLQDNMDAFVRRFDAFCKAEHVKKILTEIRWGFTVDYKPTGFWDKDVYFRGQLDLGAVTGDDTLFVLDHKSGMAKAIDNDAPKKQQLQSYAVLALPNMPEITGVRSGVHFLQGDNPDLRLQWMDYIPAANVRLAYAPWLFGRINECASALIGERFDAKVAKKKLRGWPCHWCNYQSLCPDYRRKFGNG